MSSRSYPSVVTIVSPFLCDSALFSVTNKIQSSCVQAMGLQGAEVILMRLQKAYATKLLQAQPELRKEKHDH